MNAASSTVPSSPHKLYLARRGAGLDHATAVRDVEHSYGRRDLGAKLELARAEHEAVKPQATVKLPEVIEPHPLDAPMVEVGARIRELTDARAVLALDALSDQDAHERLVTVERDLAAAEAERDRLQLARHEAFRREHEQTLQAEQEAVRVALERTRHLQVERDQAEAKLAKAAADFGKALTFVHEIAADQTAALNAAGEQGWRVVPSPAATRATLTRALHSAGAPTDWLS